MHGGDGEESGGHTVPADIDDIRDEAPVADEFQADGVAAQFIGGDVGPGGADVRIFDQLPGEHGSLQAGSGEDVEPHSVAGVGELAVLVVEGAFEADDAFAGKDADTGSLSVERLEGTKSSAPASMPLTRSDLSGFGR